MNCFSYLVLALFQTFSSSYSNMLSQSTFFVSFRLFRLTAELVKVGPLEAILVIFGRTVLIFFSLKALAKNLKMTPLLCACAV